MFQFLGVGVAETFDVCCRQSIFRLPALVSFPLSPFGGRSSLGFFSSLDLLLRRSFHCGPAPCPSLRLSPWRWYFSRSASFCVRCLLRSLSLSVLCLACSRCISSANWELRYASLGALAGLSGLTGLPGLSGLPGLPGLSDLSGLSGLSGLSRLAGGGASVSGVSAFWAAASVGRERLMAMKKIKRCRFIFCNAFCNPKNGRI